MRVTIYVGNLPWAYRDNDLAALFEPHGTVTSATVIVDRSTGRSRGFGFVEMASDSQANRAIEAMKGSEAGGRPLDVNWAKGRRVLSSAS